MRVVWAPRALLRVTEIAEYIAADRPAAAQRWVEDLFTKVAGLRSQPKHARKVPELNRDDLREILYGEYRLIYRLEAKRLVVLTVRHGRRRWEQSEVEPEV